MAVSKKASSAKSGNKGGKAGAKGTARKRTSAPPVDAEQKQTLTDPKTTHPVAAEQREPEPKWTAAERMGRTLDAFPDRIDIRDWVYHPTLQPLPNRLINVHEVPKILDQGTEGACTGYALAAVINFLLYKRRMSQRVSPRMLYELARRYDEWPGEEYEGSSARGAMKGWVKHGVCCEDSWEADKKGLRRFTADIAREALEFPGGAFYRVMHRQVRDMHSALNETGILYCTLMVHSGWGDEELAQSEILKITYDDRSGNNHEIELPVIQRKGRADSGHAVAIVGYTREGFIIQNSWSESWGKGGYALLPYDDYLMHSTDVWVAQLGVPVASDLWVEEKWTETTAGLARVQEAIHLNNIRPYIIDVANNGELSTSGDYWTTEDDIRQLFTETIPNATVGWEKKRILLYLHGGLNDEKSVARRVVAFRDVMLANQIYPLHIMWETGVMETLRGIIADYFTDVDDRAGGVADWLRKFRNGLIEAKDRTFEVTVAGLGAQLWSEMKENARIASRHPRGKGAMQIIRKMADQALRKFPQEERDKWEVHVVAHSAGSIFAGYALPALTALDIRLASMQLLAPAITIADFNELYMPYLTKKGGRSAAPPPTMYLLSDKGELDDGVGPYGKSLLYLVSNAFEGKRETPLLGMERFIGQADWDTKNTYREVRTQFQQKVSNWQSMVIAGAGDWDPNNPGNGQPNVCKSETHGGFDNDPYTLNSVLWRILGEYPMRPFSLRDLQY